ncbi:TrmH family RNA methyltransferase [Spirochaeta cellobiosiphila]|uniref:TrmH family RNA methyltransferase n=1 Tax=Spirochaeta cellobiosiphila TaxID=504483 RepID=UPI0003FDDE32|nr:TrmH family RNA methyltransferase [Spirochaeta cellobiosiphila]
MITIKKLKTLKETTRIRKYGVILQSLEQDLINGRIIDKVYLLELSDLIKQEVVLPLRIRNFDINRTDARQLLFSVNKLRHLILQYLGAEPADWDMPIEKGEDTEGKNYPFKVHLDGIRSPFNIGSIMRTLEAYGGSEFSLSPYTTSPEHPRAIRSSMGCDKKLSWKYTNVGDIPGPVFALELGGTSINQFDFPSSGTVILGSEELGISPEARKKTEASAGIVSIPLVGSKASLNVGVAFGILMSWWYQNVS